MERLPGELSGGQKQRVCIARALAAEPQAVICDEITSALDQIVAEGILRLLQKLQEDLGWRIFSSPTDISLVRAVADEVALMRHGRLEALDGRGGIFCPAAWRLRLAATVLRPRNAPRLADRHSVLPSARLRAIRPAPLSIGAGRIF